MPRTIDPNGLAKDTSAFVLGFCLCCNPADRRAGVAWHTQGSGKSFSMLFFAARVVRHPAMQNPTLVVLTDRNDLDDQLFGQFQRCADILGQCAGEDQSDGEAHPEQTRVSAGLAGGSGEDRAHAGGTAVRGVGVREARSGNKLQIPKSKLQPTFNRLLTTGAGAKRKAEMGGRGDVGKR